jgi:hypothetical protein
MNDLNAVCAIFFPTVNQAECCGINTTIPIRKHVIGEQKMLVQVNAKTNWKLENDIYSKSQTKKNKCKLIAGTYSSVSTYFSTSKDYVKAFLTPVLLILVPPM